MYERREELRKPIGALKIKGQKPKICKMFSSIIFCMESIIHNSQYAMAAKDQLQCRNDNNQEFIFPLPPKFNEIFSMH